jgi:hypothetical protein
VRQIELNPHFGNVISSVLHSEKLNVPQAMDHCPRSGDRVIAPGAVPIALSCAGCCWAPAASAHGWSVRETAAVPIKVAAIAAAERIFTVRDIMLRLM